MACKLSFERRETVEKLLALVRSYLVVFEDIGDWSGALDPLDESTELKTLYSSFMVESSKSWDSGRFLQQTPDLLFV